MSIPRRSARVLLAVLPVLAAAQAGAATINFNDGGVHTISGPSPDVAVTNGTTLIVQDGAVITGGAPSISIDQTSIFTATGGSITAAGASAASALSSAGSTTISGGTFQGGLFSGSGASISGPATISGGTFQGGGAEGNGGSGASISGPVTISGGTFQGGSGFFGPSGAAATISGAATVQVLGGTFAGRISLGLTSGGADFFGSLAFADGQLTGALADGMPINQPVSLGGATALSSPGEIRFLGPTFVPAPPALVLLATGLLGVLGAGWPRRRQGGLRAVTGR